MKIVTNLYANIKEPRLVYHIILSRGIIGLFLAYRTCGRSNGLGLGLFLFFYTIVVLFKLFEIGINIVLNVRKIYKKYR